MSLSKALDNSLWILIASGVNKVSSVLLLVILTRFLGAEGFGNFSYALFYVMFFSSLTEMGLTPVLIRFANADGAGAGKVQGIGLAIGLLSTGCAVLLAWVGTIFLGLGADIRLLIYIASASLFISFRDITFRWILEVPFRARLKMVCPAVIGIVSELTGLLLVIAAVYRNSSVELILFLYVVSNVPGFFLLAFLSFREFRPNLRPGGVGALEVLREALPIGASNFMITVYLAVGALVLFRYVGAAELGYYALAFRLSTSLRIIPEAMMHSLLPLMAEAHMEGMEGVRELFARAVKYASFIAFPLAFGTVAVAPSVATLIGGEGFAQASVALSILIWVTFLAFFNTVLRFTFNAVALQRFNFWVYLAIVVSTVVLSLVFIPVYGLAGACFALLLSEALGLIFGAVAGRRVGLWAPVGLMVKFFTAAVVMTVVIWSIPHLILQLMAGLTIYTLLLIFLGGVERRELLCWLRLG